MGQVLLVTLREGIEMFLIVAIAAAYLRKTGRAALLPAVAWGTGTAVIVSVVLGVWLAEVAVLPKWEALLALVAAVLVISMVIYMLRAAKEMRRHIGPPLDNVYWHIATEPYGPEGEYGAMLTYALVLVPAAWLAISAFKVRAARLSNPA